ncbi:G-protein coupled receptor 55-like isoform X1 [Conger conger]|uniref:G-protein coupled receptor 55-like isoform X1 n=1 Tax=Conger conger TaxID=82655 RepID=UPI002A59EC0C|nr:G-protein coupled receptor 55-like isoform X1 [Conger conger]
MNCDLNITEELQTAQMVLSVPTFVLGLMGNVAVLGMFCCRRGQSWTYMMVYITNMALADCTVLFSLPFKIYSYRNEWPFSTDFCLVLVSVYYVNMYVSIYTATAISVVRYVGIKYPFKAKEILSPRKALLVCAFIWVLLCSLSACFHRVDTPEENATRIVCFQKRKKEPLPIPFILVLELLGYALPLITMSFCSVQVIRALSKQTSASSQMDKKIQCIRIMAANWVVFVVCFTPIHFGFLLKYIVESHTEDCGLLRGVHSFMHFSFVIANMNCCLDAFSYYFATRDSWKRLSTCCQSKAGISQNAII